MELKFVKNVMKKWQQIVFTGFTIERMEQLDILMFVKGVLKNLKILEENLERYIPIFQTSMCVQYV